MKNIPYNQLQGTCYLEFQREKYKNTCWLETSLFYEEDDFCELFSKSMKNALRNYDYYAFINIKKDEFPALKSELLKNSNQQNQNDITFFINWAEEQYEKSGYISFLGM